MSPGRVAVFLDRDGVVNERPAEHDYVRARAQFRWLPGARDALARLHHGGFPLVVVSNQRGIGRGLVSWETLGEIEQLIQQELRQDGASIAGFYYCPHDRGSACGCRKPAPGLLLRAAEELELDLSCSVMLGDAKEDVVAGRRAGCLTALIGQRPPPCPVDFVAPSLALAADQILAARENRATEAERRRSRPR